MSNLLLRLKQRLGFSLAPHEKAELGLGTWGRQEAKATPKASLKVRVWRAATQQWEEK